MIRLRFYPNSPNGLLLFTSYSDFEFGDFLALALVNRSLQFSYSLGAGVNTVTSLGQLELNAWYTVEISLEGGNATLSIDGQVPTFAIPPFMFLTVHSNVWLGGYSNFINISSLTGTSQGFNGSMSLLEINGRMVDFILDAEFGFGVTQSETSTCAGDPCLNGGRCVEVGPSFVCECVGGYTGLLCGSVLEPCVIGASLCALGSTCQANSNGINFTCLCPVGRGGDLCDQGESCYIAGSWENIVMLIGISLAFLVLFSAKHIFISELRNWHSNPCLYLL